MSGSPVTRSVNRFKLFGFTGLESLLLGLALVCVEPFSATGAALADANWRETGSLVDARFGQTTTLLQNGKVLVAGGHDDRSSTLASAELYDPANGTWTTTGSMAAAREFQTATLLPNGKVLVAGGFNSDSRYLASAELYDPVTGTWTATGDLTASRWEHTASLLSNGKVLVAGGQNDSGYLAEA